MNPVSLIEKDFILSSAKDKIRTDGRSLDELRNISIQLSRTYEQSSSIVSYGDTKVCAITTSEICTPFPDRPNEGLFDIKVVMNGMGGRSMEKVNMSETTEFLRILERSLKANNTLDVESLCIIPGEKVFSVTCSVSVLNNCGNLFDAAVLAATSSLSHYRRLDYSINGKEVTVYPAEEHEPVPLCLHYKPICVSFAILDNEATLIDPNEREEAIMAGKISIILNAFGEMCGFHYLGGVALPSESFLQCVKTASVKATEISEVLNQTLTQTN